MTSWSHIFVVCAGLFFLRFSSGDEPVKLVRTNLTLRQVSLKNALRTEGLYPRVDFSRLDLSQPTIENRSHVAVILENEYIQTTILPEMGRIYSLVSRVSGHNLLWTNPIARPIGAHNDTGWWLVFGGIEHTIPGGEHGTTWALAWDWEVASDKATGKAVRMSVREPGTGLRQQLEVGLNAGTALLETRLSVSNTTRTNVLFAHWVNPMLAPGGRNQVTPRTEMIVPCTAMLIPDRDFNRWILGATKQRFGNNPLRWMEHWRAPGDLLVEELTGSFFGAYCHEEEEGIARVFDRAITPGMDIWTWGFPPPPARQREYSLEPNLGYIEMWGGTAKDYSDASRRSLAPGGILQWTEHWLPFRGTGGLTFADTNAAIRFARSAEKDFVELGIQAVRSGRAEISVHAGNVELSREKLVLNPATAIRRKLALPGGAPLPGLKIGWDGGARAELVAEQMQPLEWGGTFLKRE